MRFGFRCDREANLEQTAALGVIIGTKIELKAQESSNGSPWLIVLGAAGGVGQFAVQVHLLPCISRMILYLTTTIVSQILRL